MVTVSIVHHLLDIISSTIYVTGNDRQQPCNSITGVHVIAHIMISSLNILQSGHDNSNARSLMIYCLSISAF